MAYIRLLNGCPSKTIDASSCSNVRSWVFDHSTTFVNRSRGSACGLLEILTQDSNSLMVSTQQTRLDALRLEDKKIP